MEDLLHDACLQGKTELVSKLLAMGAALEKTNSQSYTPLHLACIGGNVDIVSLLLKCGASIEAQFDKGGRAMHLAAVHNQPRVIAALCDYGAIVDCRDQVRASVRPMRPIYPSPSSVGLHAPAPGLHEGIC